MIFDELLYKNQDKIYYNILSLAKPGDEYRLAFRKEFEKCWDIATEVNKANEKGKSAD